MAKEMMCYELSKTYESDNVDRLREPFGPERAFLLKYGRLKFAK